MSEMSTQMTTGDPQWHYTPYTVPYVPQYPPYYDPPPWHPNPIHNHFHTCTVMQLPKPRKFKKSCKVIGLAAEIAHSKRPVDERVKELADLRDYIDSLMASIKPTT